MASNLVTLFYESCKRNALRPAVLSKSEGGYKLENYDEFLRRVFELASGLMAMGVAQGDRVAILAENSSNWAVIDWSVLSVGAVTVPIYPTLMPETIAYILQDSDAKTIFVGDQKLESKAKESIHRTAENIQVISLENESNATSIQECIKLGLDQLMSEDDFVKHLRCIQPNDVATIIYTSGTTGEPKGVVLSHKAFVSQATSIQKSLPINENDRFFSFLPLSHVYERMAGHFLPFLTGCSIAYAESIRTIAQDITFAKPTIILAVPRFLESVRVKIMSSVAETSFLKQIVFNAAIKHGPNRLSRNCKTSGLVEWLLDKIVAKKIRARFGGRLRFFVSGGAALQKETAEFFAAFGIPIVQGYGLTETAPVISINHPDRNQPDSVGEVLEGVEVRIAEDGEILMRGPNLMEGYLNKPEETRIAIDNNGWFHTGDIGRLENNRLWITDRKKDIIVMANGKNVAPIAIEENLKKSAFIDDAMVIGDEWIT
jgi:long-chain acyl-CoA synthetase